MQRKRVPFWLAAVLLMAIIMGFFYLAAFVASNASFLVAVLLFALAMVVLYLSELRA